MPIKPDKLLIIHFSWNGQTIQIRRNIKTGSRELPIRQFEERVLERDVVTALTREYRSLIHKIERQSETHEILTQLLEALGRHVVLHFFPRDLIDTIGNGGLSHILLVISDRLLTIPFELAWINNDFLCLRHSIGRVVETRQPSRYHLRKKPGLNMLILADTAGNLPQAWREGADLKNFIEGFGNTIEVELRARHTPRQFLRRALSQYRIIHFAGHAQYSPDNPEQCGWVFEDGIFHAREMESLEGAEQLPELIFSNACDSGRTDAWANSESNTLAVHDPANAFLIGGVHHYIGTDMKIPDEMGFYYAKKFYRHYLNHRQIGESIRLSRLALRKAFPETAFWCAWILYGDPGNYLFEPSPSLSLWEHLMKFFSNKLNIIVMVSFLSMLIIGWIGYRLTFHAAEVIADRQNPIASGENTWNRSSESTPETSAEILPTADGIDRRDQTAAMPVAGETSDKQGSGNRFSDKAPSVSSAAASSEVTIIRAYQEFMETVYVEEFTQMFHLEIKAPGALELGMVHPLDGRYYRMMMGEVGGAVYGTVIFTNNRQAINLMGPDNPQAYLNMSMKEIAGGYPIDTLRIKVKYSAQSGVRELDTVIRIQDRTADRISRALKADAAEKPASAQGSGTKDANAPRFMEASWSIEESDDDHFKLSIDCRIFADPFERMEIRLPWDAHWYGAVNSREDVIVRPDNNKIDTGVNMLVEFLNNPGEKKFFGSAYKFIPGPDTIWYQLENENIHFVTWKYAQITDKLPLNQIRCRLFQAGKEEPVWEGGLTVKKF